MTNKTTYKYEIGQTVFYTNEYGVEIGNFVITDRCVWNGEYYQQPKNRYYLDKTDTPWFPVDETCLSNITE